MMEEKRNIGIVDGTPEPGGFPGAPLYLAKNPNRSERVQQLSILGIQLEDLKYL